MPRSRRPQTRREYPRSARLNELLREILADELERIDDDRLELATITSVSVDNDLRHGIVFFDCLDGEAGDAETTEALESHRVRLQAAIGREARVRRVPGLSFRPDPAVRGGERIDDMLRDMGDLDGPANDAASTSGADGATADEGAGAGDPEAAGESGS